MAANYRLEKYTHLTSKQCEECSQSLFSYIYLTATLNILNYASIKFVILAIFGHFRKI